MIPKATPPISQSMKLIVCLLFFISFPGWSGAQTPVNSNPAQNKGQANLTPEAAANISIRGAVYGSQRIPFYPPKPPSEASTALSKKLESQIKAQKAPKPYKPRRIREAAQEKHLKAMQKLQEKQNQQAFKKYVRFFQDRSSPPRYNGVSRNFTAFNSSFQSIIRVPVNRTPIFRVPPRRMNLSDIRRPPRRTGGGGGKSLSSIRRPKRTTSKKKSPASSNNATEATQKVTPETKASAPPSPTP